MSFLSRFFAKFSKKKAIKKQQVEHESIPSFILHPPSRDLGVSRRQYPRTKSDAYVSGVDPYAPSRRADDLDSGSAIIISSMFDSGPSSDSSSSNDFGGFGGGDFGGGGSSADY